MSATSTRPPAVSPTDGWAQSRKRSRRSSCSCSCRGALAAVGPRLRPPRIAVASVASAAQVSHGACNTHGCCKLNRELVERRKDFERVKLKRAAKALRGEEHVFVQTAVEHTSIQNRFIQMTFSSKFRNFSSNYSCARKHFIPKPFHRKHFHPNTHSSNDSFIQTRIHPKSFSYSSKILSWVPGRGRTRRVGAQTEKKWGSPKGGKGIWASLGSFFVGPKRNVGRFGRVGPGEGGSMGEGPGKGGPVKGGPGKVGPGTGCPRETDRIERYEIG